MLSDMEFRDLLSYLDRSWAGYRRVRKGVKKRVRRHMQTLGCSNVNQYLIALARNSANKAACEGCLRVTISRFFRDRQLWQALRAEILPGLVDRFSTPIRIWSAGCASGEEPYTVAIVWNERLGSLALDLLATDANGTCLDRARHGVYTGGSLKAVPDDIRRNYFVQGKGGRQFSIRSDRLPPIRWRRHDLLDRPPETRPFHMILLRNNLLTYYQGRAQRTAFVQLVSVLLPGGYLIIGTHDRLPKSEYPLTKDPCSPWVYRLKR